MSNQRKINSDTVANRPYQIMQRTTSLSSNNSKIMLDCRGETSNTKNTKKTWDSKENSYHDSDSDQGKETRKSK
jgi:hypothetical protein